MIEVKWQSPTYKDWNTDEFESTDDVKVKIEDLKNSIIAVDNACDGMYGIDEVGVQDALFMNEEYLREWRAELKALEKFYDKC